MKLQIQHVRSKILHKNHTIACLKPTRAILEALERELEAGKEPVLELDLGTAVLHPLDKEWRKNTGREVAVKNMIKEKFTLIVVQKEIGKTIFVFLTTEGLRAKFLLSTNREDAFLKDLYYGDI